MHAVFSAQALN